MRKIASPLSGFGSPFGPRRASGVAPLDPADLFEPGDYGLHFDALDQSSVALNADGTGAVDEDDLIRYLADLTGNGLHATTTVDAERPSWKPTGVHWGDRSAQNLRVTFPARFQGTWIWATTEGVMVTTVDIPAGAWELCKGPFDSAAANEYDPPIFMLFAPGDLVGMVMIDRAITDAERLGLLEYYRRNGSIMDWSGRTGSRADGLDECFRGRTELITFDGRHFNIGQCQSVNNFFRDCSNLVSALCPWDMSSMLEIKNFTRQCQKLAHIDTTGWSFPLLTNGQQAFENSRAVAAWNCAGWGMGECQLFQNMFSQNREIEDLEHGDWDVSKGRNFQSIHANMHKLKILDLRKWDTGACESGFNRFAFQCFELETVLLFDEHDNCLAFQGAETRYNDAFKTCALSEQSVNDILRAVERAGTSGGRIDLDGGTNAPPTGAGVTARDALVARGWTVNVNAPP